MSPPTNRLLPNSLCWPSAEFSGAAYADGRRETDGIFETEECIHIVESTTSRTKLKAKQDAEKIEIIMQRYQNNLEHRAVRGWFVTKDEPTVDQRTVVERIKGIYALSFSQFQARLIDANAYLNARDHYQFGSVRDPVTGNHVSDVEYVPLDLTKEGSGEIVFSSRPPVYGRKRRQGRLARGLWSRQEHDCP